jgi:hypothetical protein
MGKVLLQGTPFSISGLANVLLDSEQSKKAGVDAINVIFNLM